MISTFPIEAIQVIDGTKTRRLSIWEKMNPDPYMSSYTQNQYV